MLWYLTDIFRGGGNINIPQKGQLPSKIEGCDQKDISKCSEGGCAQHPTTPYTFEEKLRECISASGAPKATIYLSKNA